MGDGDPIPVRLPDREPVVPPEPFVAGANVTDAAVREAFEETWPDCWRRAGDLLEWATEYDAVLPGDPTTPPFEWFAGGELNASHNCLDRHLDERGDEVAIEWVGEPGETRTYTYRELHREVNEFAAARKHQ